MASNSEDDFLSNVLLGKETPRETKQHHFHKNDHEHQQAISDKIMEISDSEDEFVPFVPLAQTLKELKKKKRDSICESFTAIGGKHHKRIKQSNLTTPEWPLHSSPPHKAFSGSKSRTFSQRVDLDNINLEHQNTKKNIAICRAHGQAMLSRKLSQPRLESLTESLDQRHREKAERKALAEAARAMRPEHCIKYMVVAVDPALLQVEGGGTLLVSVQAMGCGCSIEKQPFPRSVSWMRKSASTQEADAVSCVEEAPVVIQMMMQDFITLVHSYVQQQRNCMSDGNPTLTSWVEELQRRHPTKVLSLTVIELEKYFRPRKSQVQKRPQDSCKVRDDGTTGGPEVRKGEPPKVSRAEVEEAVVHLQLHTGVLVHFLATWKDFTDCITMTTKAIAETPFKQEQMQSAFSFYVGGEWAGGSRVDKEGKGLFQVWKRQIQQLNRVSAGMASAILAMYPSPQLLNEAYCRCKSNSEKFSLLSDILIRRGEGVTSTTRRVGPELSKRIYLLMNSSNPQQILDT